MFITENTMWNRLCFESDMFLYFEQISQIKVLFYLSQFFVPRYLFKTDFFA